MRRRARTGRGLTKPGPRKTITRKRRTGPKAARRPAAIAGSNSKTPRLRRALDEAYRQQAATAEVLKVISGSAFDLQAVLDRVTASAARLCDADIAGINRQRGSSYYYASIFNCPPGLEELFKSAAHDMTRGSVTGRALLDGKTVHIPDVFADPEYKLGDLARQIGFRTTLGVPLLREGRPIGVIVLMRTEVRPFSDKQIALVSTFADQAVIAIENVRLFDELQQRTADLTESLQQQTATSDVLEVISRSAFDLQPVFETVAESAVKLCGADRAIIFRYDGELLRLVAAYNTRPDFREWVERNPIKPGRHSGAARAALERRTIHVPDVLADSEYSYGAKTVESIRTILGVPILKGDELLGVIMIFRLEVNPFAEKQIALVETFADQAAIAIENVRLFDEVQKRTADLTESLEQQTATSAVLSVISSAMGDLDPVFASMVKSAARLLDVTDADIMLREGDMLRLVAKHGSAAQWPLGTNPPLSRDWVTGRAVIDRQVVHVDDLQACEDEYPSGASYARQYGHRTTLAVPLLQKESAIGAILIRRMEVKPFTQKQIGLVQNFAAQAVIAIENARLLSEQRQALEQQTATADVLKVISRSTFDLQTVLDTLVESATRLCHADNTHIFLRDGDLYRLASSCGFTPDYVDFLKRNPVAPADRERPGLIARVASEGSLVHIPDALADPDYKWADALRLGGYRAMLGIPMLREGNSIGVMAVTRSVPEPFTDKQIELLTTFADQAVIAIENVRLFDEVQKRTRDLSESLQQQTATADVLKVISRSTFDLQTVLRTLVESATRLCDADKGTITRKIGEHFYRAEAYGFSAEFMDYVKDIPIEPERGSVAGRALLEGKIVHIPDVGADPEYTLTEAQKLGDYRTILGVPMLREGVPIGIFALTRSEVRPFTEKQIDLVSTFADQAAIAIENVRLFEQTETRTRELAKSLEELRAAQDRLVQTEKLASLGQLTAGIAHEIKNPLNFVNNFSSLSVEMVDELRETLEAMEFDEAVRSQVAELIATLRGNLDRIVQHGGRADSIVKNMLLHSRQGSAEHRIVDVNALVEEAVNLAYHGARAERQGFTIALEWALDPGAGRADLFPQEVTRVLLNIVANGFYAAIKRKERTDDGREPSLSAATRDLGDRVEIRIRDNGDGIPPDVKDKIFNPFFTTKPAGEGTGLGLSISHDIVVKQHAGSLEIDTVSGEFTEFRIVLPRAGLD